MPESDQIVCSIKVAGAVAAGYLYIDPGSPVAAKTCVLLQEEGLSAILIPDNTSIEIHHYNGLRRREIHKPLLPVIYRSITAQGRNYRVQQVPSRPQTVTLGPL